MAQEYAQLNTLGLGSTEKWSNSNTKNCIIVFFSLYPEDLVPFSRKPLMVIVDSSNSYAFRVSLNKTPLRSFYSLQIHVLTIHVLTDPYEVVNSAYYLQNVSGKSGWEVIEIQ